MGKLGVGMVRCDNEMWYMNTFIENAIKFGQTIK
jgi:hypothetical protein